MMNAVALLWLAEARFLAGDRDEAHALARRSLVRARELGERGHEAWGLRMLGEILAGDTTSSGAGYAVQLYREASALAKERGMRPLAAHCHLGLGRLYARTGETEKARAALRTAIDLYRVMDMTYWLDRANAALPDAR